MADLNITITDAPRSAITVASPGPQGPAGAGLSPIADDRLLGNVSGSTATPSALNATQVKELLGYVSSADLQAALADYATLVYVGATFAPIVHTHAISDVTNLQTALDGKAALSHAHGNITNAGAIGSAANLPLITTTSGVITTGSFGTSANTFCQGNDSRLSDARTPTSHVHGNISNAGAIGTTSGLPIITGTSGVLQVGSFGTTSGTFAQGNDTRIVNAAQTNAANTFTQSQTIANAVFLSGNNPTLGPSTVDGSDNQIFFGLGGGGFGPTTRGPHFAMHGLDATTRPGNIELHAGLNAEVRLGGDQGGGHVIGLAVRPNGMCRFLTGTWHGDDGGNQREFYAANSTSFHKGLGTTPHEWYNGSDATVLRLGSGGELTLFGGINCAQRAKAAVLASSVAMNSGRFQLTDAGLVGRVVYPDGTNWRYEHDNSIVT